MAQPLSPAYLAIKRQTLSLTQQHARFFISDTSSQCRHRCHHRIFSSPGFHDTNDLNDDVHAHESLGKQKQSRTPNALSHMDSQPDKFGSEGDMDRWTLQREDDSYVHIPAMPHQRDLDSLFCVEIDMDPHLALHNSHVNDDRHACSGIDADTFRTCSDQDSDGHIDVEPHVPLEEFPTDDEPLEELPTDDEQQYIEPDNEIEDFSTDEEPDKEQPHTDGGRGDDEKLNTKKKKKWYNFSNFGRRAVGFIIFSLSSIFLLPMSLCMISCGAAMLQASPLLAILLLPFWGAIVTVGIALFATYLMLVLISIALVHPPLAVVLVLLYIGCKCLGYGPTLHFVASGPSATSQTIEVRPSLIAPQGPGGKITVCL
ncbi:hypothetical protein GOP47_0018259 [Adiantum capillus-veneris]|uniref:Uncharacterized protein n=1 Tax=Adiantum capillus-veneris TaxID=13818 RepID=A0A9D4UGZ1_ADICA|nr:hypothetical protein GOP47_0018259 [Adiantum capillus-veneris]